MDYHFIYFVGQFMTEFLCCLKMTYFRCSLKRVTQSECYLTCYGPNFINIFDLYFLDDLIFFKLS